MINFISVYRMYIGYALTFLSSLINFFVDTVNSIVALLLMQV
jgi:hypothetical protein